MESIRLVDTEQPQITICGTYGRGLKPFIENYLISKDISVLKNDVEGRIRFLAPNLNSLGQLAELKFFERLFLSVFMETLAQKTSKSEILACIRLAFAESLSKLILSLEKLRPEKVFPLRKDHTEECTPITFRVNCKITGKKKSRIDGKRLAVELGSFVTKTLVSVVNLKEPDFEISVKINDQSVFIGVPLFRTPITLRPYLNPSGLRAPVCDAMVSLIRAEKFMETAIIIDPFCGTGNLLMETLNDRKHTAFVIGMDLVDQTKIEPADPPNFDHTTTNTTSSRFARTIFKFFKRLPFRENVIDCVLSDMPFGQKFEHNSFDCLADFYEHFLFECLRLLSKDGQVVVLISFNMVETVKSIAQRIELDFKRFSTHDYYPISLGLNSACICSLVVDVCPE